MLWGGGTLPEAGIQSQITDPSPTTDPAALGKRQKTTLPRREKRKIESNHENSVPRYLIISRTEEQQSFRTVNPFVIQKGLDAIAGPSFGSKESYDQTGRSSTSYSDIVFTFVLLNLPTNIKAGYEVIPLRPYIRALLRCFQCQQYRHSRLNCRRTEVICMTCAQIAQEGECVAPPRCAAGSGDHIVISKQCPRFIEEQKIQEICTFERISFQEARQKVHALHPTFLARGGFSTVVAAPVHKTSIATQTDATPVNPTLQPQVVTLQKKQIATVSENPLQKGSSSINNHINPYTPRRQSPVLLPYRHSRSRTPIIRPPKTKDLPDISPSSSSGSGEKNQNSVQENSTQSRPSTHKKSKLPKIKKNDRPKHPLQNVSQCLSKRF
ncbi:hypothetical protein C0J52_28348 [Blattella germanica]|nr:hypothetical protein C0J52_28348 [Blattella germanica]